MNVPVGEHSMLNASPKAVIFVILLLHPRKKAARCPSFTPLGHDSRNGREYDQLPNYNTYYVAYPSPLIIDRTAAFAIVSLGRDTS